MGRHRESPVVSLLAGRLNDLRRHLQNSGLALFLRVHDPAGDHQLDQVRSLRRDLAHTPYRLFGGGNRVSQRSGHMSAGHRDSLIARQDPGTGHCLAGRASAQQRADPFRGSSAHRNSGHACSRLPDRLRQAARAARAFLLSLESYFAALFDLIPQSPVKIRNSSDCPDRGHAAVKRCIGVSPHKRAHALSGDLIGSGDLRKAHIVFRRFLLSGRLPAGVEVYVKIDQSGHQIAAPEIHDPAA